MNISHLIGEVFRDLRAVAEAGPNERLPKEEQIRSCIYATLRGGARAVCAEHGYASVNDGSRSECDIWTVAAGGEESWLEFKRCWAVAGWNNKPSEQVESWRYDVGKLRTASRQSDRYFLLVGFFDFDPLAGATPKRRPLIDAIAGFYAEREVFQEATAFTWQNGGTITHMAAWVWHWPPGATVENAA